MSNIRINIEGITEENRFEKIAKFDDIASILKTGKAVEKSNNATQRIEKPDNPRIFHNIKFNINYSTTAEGLRKIDKALRLASFSLDVPLKASGGEGFNFESQKDLTDRWCERFSKIVRATYDFVIKYFGLPEITVMSKAGELTWKGKILYSPETGEPIKKSEWESFVKTLEKFLNRNIANAADKIILDSTALGKILDRMLKTNSLEAVRKMRLDSLKTSGKTFDWISESVKNMKNTSGDFLTRNDYARIQIMQDSAAEKIKKVSAAMKSDIKQILIDGALEHKSKTQVSQMIFDKMIGHNRDFQRIADTEIQRASTNAFVKEEVYKAEEGEKVYFQRIEVIDDNTCEYCKKINGRIAVWSDTPLSSGAVRDKYAELAIWEGKEWSGKKIERISDAPVSVCHPYCYSDDTEVMTNKGFKLFKDLNDSDLIMSINPDTKEIDFLPFVKRIEYEFDGKMINFPGRNYDLLVTPDHNMLYVDRYSRELKSMPAKELLKYSAIELPRAVGNWNKSDEEETLTIGKLIVSKKQYMKLWGWYLSEGSGRYKEKYNCYEVKIAQKDPLKIVNDLPDFASVLRVGKEAVYICGEVAKRFSEMYSIHATNKYIPDFIKNTSSENIQAFLDAYIRGDGTNKMFKAHPTSYTNQDTVLKRCFWTSSPKMADDLCELIIKTGKMPSVHIVRNKGKTVQFKNGTYTTNVDMYWIGVCDSKTRTYFLNSPRKGHKPLKVPFYQDYKGKVYDVELEKWHFLLVRRNGKCAWSGNCRGTWIRHYPELDLKI